MTLTRLGSTLEGSINSFTRKKGKLNRDELESFANQTTILKSLLEGQGFDSLAQELLAIRKDVLKHGSIEEKDLKRLKGILTKIES